ncbi:MAG TPA: AAA family ATPase [Acidimicrobiales bacterium]|nr:AAA family ATPase [Acidimicrobiales bacterium]
MRHQLLEREEVLALLERALERLRAGVGGVHFIVGEPGLGKTALLEATAGLGGRAVRVVRASGSAMEVDVPFGLVARALEPLGGRPLVAGGADAGEARAAVLQRVRGWIEAAAMDAPVVVLLDDLHWSDADSLDVVSFLARALGGARVALVAAMRPWPASARRTADLLVGDGVAASTTLRPLSRPGSDHLLAVLLEERPSGLIAEGAWEFARGTPT